MIRAPRLPIPVICAITLAIPDAASPRGFETMAQPVDAEDSCRAPRPPKDLAETAYIRNGYRAILRIMAAEKWKETGECRCEILNFTWEKVVEKSKHFVTSDNPRRPFDVVALDKQATALEDDRLKACSIE